MGVCALVGAAVVVYNVASSLQETHDRLAEQGGMDAQLVSRLRQSSSGPDRDVVRRAARLVEVLGSEDGTDFAVLGRAAPDDPGDEAIAPCQVTVGGSAVRHLRIHVHHQSLPEGHDGAGQGAWVFVDEIVVE